MFFIPSTKAHSLLSQIRMKRFPFQLLPPSLYGYLNPRLRGFSANKLSSFQVAFPFSHCFWQSVHVKPHKCCFVLGVFVPMNLANRYARPVQPPTAAPWTRGRLRAREVLQSDRANSPKAGRHPCCSSSLCVNPAYLRGLLLELCLPGSISWVAIKANKPSVPKGPLIKCKSVPG